jgi:uncharacterized protein YdiU (UPF0061 family)
MFEPEMAFREWAERWRARLAHEGVAPAERARAMRLANPAFVPRNHRVEAMIAAAVGGDFEPFHALVRAVAQPWDDDPANAWLAEPPRVEERVTRTFCGT